MNLKAAAAETGAYAVNNFFAFNKLCFAAVEVRILASVPAVSIFNNEAYLSVVTCNGLKFLFFCIINGDANLLSVLAVGEPYFNADICVVAFHNGSNCNTGAAEIVKVKVGTGNADDIHITVDAAIESKVCHLGIYDLVCGVINSNYKQIAVRQSFGEVYTPGGVTAIVVSEVLAVEIYISGGVCTLKLQIILLSLGKFALFKALHIMAGAAVVIIAAVLTVHSIPAVGQVNPLTLGGNSRGQFGILGECPFCVEIVYLSHTFAP